MARHKNKIFVLDTNVILHDSSCIHQFQEHDVVIPITVIEELDQFKKGSGTINYHAREFVRALDELSGDKLFGNGVKIGPSRGNIIIRLEQPFHEDIAHNYSPGKPDHHILNTAYRLAQENSSRQVILVSKDVNLRMKAKSVGIVAQDYFTDHVKDPAALYSGHRIEENVPAELIENIYREPFEIPADLLQIKNHCTSNEYLIMRNGKKSALAMFDSQQQLLRRIDKKQAYGIMPRNAEQIFALDALTNPDIQLVTLTGKAGTGKTLLALAGALERRKNYRQIFIARPVVPLSNKDIGYLPGDIQSKLDPYMQPLYDNLGVIQNQFSESDTKNKKIKEFLVDEKLVISPLSYIRGRSLVHIYFIVDEAQNLTPHEVKTIITRAGEGTKMVFTGDIFQIDHPYLNTYSNGLSYLIEKMHGQPLYAHVILKKANDPCLPSLPAICCRAFFFLL